MSHNSHARFNCDKQATVRPRQTQNPLTFHAKTQDIIKFHAKYRHHNPPLRARQRKLDDYTTVTTPSTISTAFRLLKKVRQHRRRLQRRHTLALHHTQTNTHVTTLHSPRSSLHPPPQRPQCLPHHYYLVLSVLLPYRRQRTVPSIPLQLMNRLHALNQLPCLVSRVVPQRRILNPNQRCGHICVVGSLSEFRKSHLALLRFGRREKCLRIENASRERKEMCS